MTQLRHFVLIKFLQSVLFFYEVVRDKLKKKLEKKLKTEEEVMIKVTALHSGGEIKKSRVPSI